MQLFRSTLTPIEPVAASAIALCAILVGAGPVSSLLIGSLQSFGALVFAGVMLASALLLILNPKLTVFKVLLVATPIAAVTLISSVS